MTDWSPRLTCRFKTSSATDEEATVTRRHVRHFRPIMRIENHLQR